VVFRDVLPKVKKYSLLFTPCRGVFTFNFPHIAEYPFYMECGKGNFVKKNNFMKKMLIRKIPVIIGLAALGIIVFGSAVMLLWNGILTSVLHIGAITFWQAVGILLLAKILFGGFRGRRRHGGWREKRLQWQNMTPEEREKFRGRCHTHYKVAGGAQ
jgi:hypothetical protein